MLFSGRCLHLKQYLPSCALSHQVNPSLKIGCCIICVFNASYFEEFCKTLCSSSYDLTVYYTESYHLHAQFMHEIHIHSSFSMLLFSWNFHPCNKNGFSCCRAPRMILAAEQRREQEISALPWWWRWVLISHQNLPQAQHFEHKFLCFVDVSSVCSKTNGKYFWTCPVLLTPLAEQGAFHFSPF